MIDTILTNSCTILVDMKHFIVVNNPQDSRLDFPDVEVVSAKQYLMEVSFSSLRSAKIINLCRSYRYQSIGYYVSLLAQARGHKPFPSVQTIQDMKSPTVTRYVSADIEELIQSSLQHIHQDRFTLSVYFGHNFHKCYDRLSMRIFQQFQAPFIQAQFHKTAEKWQLQSIQPIIANEIPQDHIDFVVDISKDFFKKGINIKKKSTSRYDLAILCNPQEVSPPSNEKAISKFIKAAETIGFAPTVITKEDFSRIAEFDALFIRETTAVNHHTYRFARRAHMEGLVVIDDPESIVKCSNKVYLAELLERQKIMLPKTVIIHNDNIDVIASELGFPCILKQPDGSFSQGVTKIESEKELFDIIPDMLDKSDLLIAQEFIRTPFDWRVCVFQGQPLFACKYYMARKHWQIYERLGNGKTLSGRSETFHVSMAPKKVIRAALKAANLIGNGLYGVDIKEYGGECYIIEINDNPSIDNGVEDSILQEELYLKIMTGMFSSVEKEKSSR